MASKKIVKKPRTWWYLSGARSLPKETKEVHFEAGFAIIRVGRTMIRAPRGDVFSTFKEAAASMVPRKVWLKVGDSVVAGERVRDERPVRLDGKNFWDTDEELIFTTEAAAWRAVIRSMTKELVKSRRMVRNEEVALLKARRTLAKLTGGKR